MLLQHSSEYIAFSIIISTKDRPKLLALAEKSVLETLSKNNVEIIVIDGSQHPT